MMSWKQRFILDYKSNHPYFQKQQKLIKNKTPFLKSLKKS